MTIEARVESLEREARRNRRLVKWLGVALGLCIYAWLAAGVFLPQGLIAQDVVRELRANKWRGLQGVRSCKVTFSAPPSA